MTKKLILFAVLVLAVKQLTMAQEEKKFAPAAAKFAIGIDAGGLLNLFHSPVSFSSMGATTIFGKYYLGEKAAIPVSLTLGLNNSENQPDLSSTNTNTTKNNDFGISAGYELRNNYDRLNLNYGGKFGFATYNTVNESLVNTTTITNENKNTYVDVALFGSIEYYIATRISLEGSLNAGYKYHVRNTTNTTTTPPNSTATEAKQTGSNLGFNSSYAIALMFHF
ncbi:MAG TPA: hypothetical protein DCQ31_08050 [Bacteroidales bacterium]|nr:hypothetical protein [Bacteroidales bacterium]